MKTNKMMRLASGLLVAVLISSCAISGTFAKYVTTAAASDSARVAKFGIIVEATTNTFDEKYQGTNSVYTVNSDRSAAATAEVEDNVVAPGTKNVSSSTFKITGSAEVAVKVEMSLGNAVKDVFLQKGNYYDFTTASSTDLFTLAEDYYPVKFTLVHEYGTGAYSIKPAADAAEVTCTNTPAKGSNKAKDTVTGTLADINAVLSQLTTNMAHINPNYVFDDVFTLTWEWAFSGNDQADTVLGNLAAGEKASSTNLTEGTNYCLKEAYDFKITVTQID